MGKPTLFLHIGAPKTASSSIQHSIAINKELIESKGIYVDIVNFSKGTYYNKGLQEIISKFDSIAVDTPFPDPDKYFAEQMRAFDEGGYNSMLLSGEGLFDGRPYCDYDRIREWIKNKYDQFDIKIICYLRRQDLYIESRFNHTLKSYASLNPYSIMLHKAASDWGVSEAYDFKHEGRMTPFDYLLINLFPFTKYKDIIEKVANVFGKESITIRPFEKCQLPNGPLYDFYANFLNFSEKEISMLKAPAIVNQSVSRDILEFVSSSSIIDRTLFSHVNNILNYENNGNTYFTHEERKRFMAFHEEGNAYLAREYLGREDGKLFYEEIKEYEPYPGLSLEKAIEIRETLINLLELKNGYYYLSSALRDNKEYINSTTLSEVIESTRKIYYSNADEQMVHWLITHLFDAFKDVERPVVIYGVFGDLAEWILEDAILYSKFTNIYLSDRRLGDLYGFKSFYVVEYKYIKNLNPSAIIIAAATSGEEIRAALEKLALEDTVIYPAYDFSDEAWSAFTAPLTTPDGYVNPYWEERCDD